MLISILTYLKNINIPKQTIRYWYWKTDSYASGFCHIGKRSLYK